MMRFPPKGGPAAGGRSGKQPDPTLPPNCSFLKIWFFWWKLSSHRIVKIMKASVSTIIWYHLSPRTYAAILFFDNSYRFFSKSASQWKLGRNVEKFSHIKRPLMWSSYKEPMRNDLVSSGEEGRGKRRYSWGSRKQALIPGFPNGATLPESCQETSPWIK